MANIYWDSDCFLGWLQEDDGKTDLCRQVLQEAQDGKLMIVTSALTLAEVLRMRKKESIPKEKRDDVVNFFKNEYIEVRNLDRRIAEMARDLVWDQKIDSKDSVHVATALFYKLDMLHTFDGDLIKKTGLLGEPRLLIEKPSVKQATLNLVVDNDRQKKSGTD